MSTVFWMSLEAVVCVIAGILIGMNNPTLAAATKKLATQAKDATAQAVDKLKS